MEIIRRGNYIHLYHGKNKLASISTWPFSFFLSLPFHKALEASFGFRKEFSGMWFNCHWRRKCDHAGIGFDLDLGFIAIEVEIYDGRHWNYDENRWYLPGEDDWPEEKTVKFIDLGTFEEVGEVSLEVKGLNKQDKINRMNQILKDANLTKVEE